MLLKQLAACAALTAATIVLACTRDGAPQMATAAAQTAPPAVASPSPRPPDRTDVVASIDRLAEEALQQGPIAGLSIAVFERGRPLMAKGYGWADVQSGVPATPATSYPIASVSKQFTAALVLRLAEQGKLSLDDSLSRFFPNARAKIGALTLRHLLGHGSGLTRGGPAPRAAALNVLRRGGTALPQGVAFEYSNYNFSLLGLVLEQVTGRSYAAHVHDELAGPLGLTGTGYCEDGTAVPGRGRDYLSTPRRYSTTDYWTKPRFFAGGGLCATVLDLARFQQQLESGRIVSATGLQFMRAPWQLADGAQVEYGFGTRLGWTSGHRKFGHTGGGQGNKAVVARYPAEDLTIAVLLNTERANASVTATLLEERIAQLIFATAPPAAPPDSIDPQRYSGDYREGSWLSKVASNEGNLTVRPGFKQRAESSLFATGDGAFALAESPSNEFRFQMVAGQARGMARYRNGWFMGVASRTGD